MKDFSHLNLKLARYIEVSPVFFTYILAYNSEGKKSKWLEQYARGLRYVEIRDEYHRKSKTSQLTTKFISKIELARNNGTEVYGIHILTMTKYNEVKEFSNTDLNVLLDEVSDFLNKRKKDLVIEVLELLLADIGIDRFNVYGSKYWEWCP